MIRKRGRILYLLIISQFYCLSDLTGRINAISEINDWATRGSAAGFFMEGFWS
jgi:hypothetical protein